MQSDQVGLTQANRPPRNPVRFTLTEKLTIEHVMPQAWQTYWPLPANAKADPLTEQKAIMRRETVLNTLGNLTLITGNFNSSLQNAAWKDKKPELLTYGKLNLTQYFHGQDANEWDEAAIRMRTEHLFKLLLGMWPDASKVA
ncbi:MAG: HNH endonuclease [Betaproteobacteria bacterium]|nr:HNH endonuclease [Betaproteobacteria bacterium]